MLRELRTGLLTPKNYYELYMKVEFCVSLYGKRSVGRRRRSRIHCLVRVWTPRLTHTTQHNMLRPQQSRQVLDELRYLEDYFTGLQKQGKPVVRTDGPKTNPRPPPFCLAMPTCVWVGDTYCLPVYSWPTHPFNHHPTITSHDTT